METCKPSDSCNPISTPVITELCDNEPNWRVDVERCDHHCKKPFTLSDGKTIHCSLDCDEDRRPVLSPKVKAWPANTSDTQLKRSHAWWLGIPPILIESAELDGNLDALISDAVEANLPLRSTAEPPDSWAELPKMIAVLKRHANIHWRTNARTVPCYDEKGDFAGRLTTKVAEREMEIGGVSGDYNDEGKLVRIVPAKPIHYSRSAPGYQDAYLNVGIDSFWTLGTFVITQQDGTVKVRRLMQHRTADGDSAPIPRPSVENCGSCPEPAHSTDYLSSPERLEHVRRVCEQLARPREPLAKWKSISAPIHNMAAITQRDEWAEEVREMRTLMEDPDGY